MSDGDTVINVPEPRGTIARPRPDDQTSRLRRPSDRYERGVNLSNTVVYRVLRLLRYAWRDGEPRAVAKLDLLRPRGLFQPFGFTDLDRYPEVFAFVQSLVEDGATLELLSFGCSTGEEVFSLRDYFPEASLTGLDISADRIAACRHNLERRGGDPRTIFRTAATTTATTSGSYNVIFAMAVFRHGSLGTFPETCDHLIDFTAFEDAIADLVRCLRPLGVLVLRHANFRFLDTKAAAGFDLLLSLPASNATPLYGRDNRLLPREPDEGVVFRRRD